MKLQITPAAEILGLSLADLARQVRQVFYGEEAQRIQRGRHDIRGATLRRCGNKVKAE